MVGLQSRFIRLAEEAGVSQISLLGMHGPVANDASVLLSLLGETERDLQASRLDWTIVRTPAFLFMQNVRTQAETVQKTGRLPLPLGNGSYHLIDARDIARVLAETMTDPTHRGQYYNLTGPEALTGEILAQQLSDVAGYRVLYFPLPPVVARAHMLKQHMPSWLVDDMLTMYREADAPQVNTLIADLTGSPARTFADYLEDERWAFERGEDEGQLKGWVETSALYMRT